MSKNSKIKILLILKKRHDYYGNENTPIGVSTGLYNSALFIEHMLHDMGIEAKLVVVIDNNEIDREVTLYRPTHVIIEALWVVPEKFHILHKLHPNVKWIIRLHSQLPFLANEGIAMKWISQYINMKNVFIGVNSPRMVDEIRYLLNHHDHHKKVIYLPNYYPEKYKSTRTDKNHSIDIGCFGSIRPLKDHLIQAFAAIKFADNIGKKLKFHINIGRYEGKGEPILHNLIALFENQEHNGHKLVMHEWTPRYEFLELCRKMDIGLQVSFSETFNIVGADLISQGVPLVGSREIPWMNKYFAASPTKSDSIYRKLLLAYQFPKINVWLNQRSLRKYCNKTRKIWYDTFMIGMILGK